MRIQTTLKGGRIRSKSLKSKWSCSSSSSFPVGSQVASCYKRRLFLYHCYPEPLPSLSDQLVAVVSLNSISILLLLFDFVWCFQVYAKKVSKSDLTFSTRIANKVAAVALWTVPTTATHHISPPHWVLVFQLFDHLLVLLDCRTHQFAAHSLGNWWKPPSLGEDRVDHDRSTGNLNASIGD